MRGKVSAGSTSPSSPSLSSPRSDGFNGTTGTTGTAGTANADTDADADDSFEHVDRVDRVNRFNSDDTKVPISDGPGGLEGDPYADPSTGADAEDSDNSPESDDFNIMDEEQAKRIVSLSKMTFGVDLSADVVLADANVGLLARRITGALSLIGSTPSGLLPDGSGVSAPSGFKAG